MFFRSIRFRLALWYFAILAVILVLLSAGVYFTQRRTLSDNLDTSLRTRATLLQGLVDYDTSGHPTLDLSTALLRGRYTKAVARMERAGIPIDTRVHRALMTNWKTTRGELIRYIDRDFGLYDGETFKRWQMLIIGFFSMFRFCKRVCDSSYFFHKNLLLW